MDSCSRSIVIRFIADPGRNEQGINHRHYKETRSVRSRTFGNLSLFTETQAANPNDLHLWEQS